MTTHNEEQQNVNVTEEMNKGMTKALNDALSRFEVEVFLDWSEDEGKNVYYVELVSKDSGERVTFVKSYFQASRNANKVLDKLNLIGSANGHMHDALVEHINSLVAKKIFTRGGFSASAGNTQPLEWKKLQAALKNVRKVARNYLLKESRFALQSKRNYDSSKHLGVILDQEKGLPEGTIAVGFKGSALQAVLNPYNEIQTQKYRSEILRGLAHIGVLDADIEEYYVEEEDDEDEDIEEKENEAVDVETTITVYADKIPMTAKAKDLRAMGFKPDDNKDDKKRKKQNKKSPRLDKQRSVNEDKVGVKFYIMHFSQELLEEVAQYVAA